ncbi:MAG: hypothetical protein Q4C02_02460 [Eubacteriales bacterium]|nr:hypothetical protein [Lachnospiraceae bacterium]MDO4417124.1 hypothetical protein [Eubacteriales bacterium]
MRKSSRRFAAVLISICMLLSLAACGGGSGKGSGSGGSGSGAAKAEDGSLSMPAITIKDGVAKTQEVKLSDEDFSADGLQILAVEDGWFYGFNYSYEGDGLSGYELVRFRTDGSEFQAMPYSVDNAKDTASEAEITAAAYRDGNYYLGLVTYGNSPALDYELSLDEGQELDEGVMDSLSEDATATYELSCVSKDGKEIWKAAVEEPEESEYYYIDSISVSEEGIFVNSSEGIDKYSVSDGSFVEHVCRMKSQDLTGMLYVLPDGTVLMTDESSGSGLKVLRYDAGKGDFAQSLVLPSALTGATMFPGTEYDLYLAAEDGIYGVKQGSDKITPVVNFVNSDLDAQGVTRVIEAGDGKLAIQAYGTDVSQNTYLLEPVDPKDVKEKKQLTLGGYYIDYETRSQVIQFNKENEDFRITLVDYSQYDLADDSYESPTGLSRMNTDIISGNTPDIMVLSDYMPVKSYISKGVFMDLTSLYEADPDIERDGFMQNIVDAFRTDGKMYVAVPGFSVTGVAGKTKYIGDGKDLTIAKAKEIGQSIGLEPSQLFGVMDRASIFSSAIEFSGDQFIDREKHTCDFNNKDFEELLSFVKSFPAALNEEQYQDIYTQYLGDKALLGIQYIGSAYDYYFMTRQLYGDVNVTVTGFPAAENQGPSVAATMQLAISSSASDVDGCWNFVRRFLLPEYQMSMDSGLPISRKAIEAQGQAIIEDLKAQQEEYEAYVREMNGETGKGDQDADAAEESSPASEESMTGATGESVTEATEGMDVQIEESEDLTNKPTPEEDFNGTHEEYEAYLKDFEADQASPDSEEVIIEGADVDTPDAMEQEDPAAQYGLDSLPEFGEKDIQALMKILDGLSFSVNGEQDVLNIIQEEAEAFFAGQKSAADVCDIIQSRVSVYLKENE